VVAHAGTVARVGRLSAAAGPEGYRLAETWAVATTESIRPGRPTALSVAYAQAELLVVDAEPPRVLAMTPDGGVLREIGQGVLSDPRDAAVLTPYGSYGDRGRIFVTEPHRAVVEVFELDGTHVRTVRGFGEPWGVAASSYSVYVTDAARAQVGVLDLDGNIVSVWRADASSPTGLLVRPQEVAANVGLSEQVIVADAGTGALVWLDREGKRIGQVELGSRYGLSNVADMSLVHPEIPTNVVALTSQPRRLARVGLAPERVHVLSNAALSQADLVSAVQTDQELLCRGCSQTLYLASRDTGRLDRMHLTAEALYPACPLVGSEAPIAWRLAVSADDAVFVVNAQGVVSRVSRGGTQRIGEIGDIDDFAVTLDGTVLANVHGLRRGFAQGVSKPPPSIPHAWLAEYDCTPAGYGLQGSLDVSADGRTLDVLALGSFLEGLSAHTLHRRLLEWPSDNGGRRSWTGGRPGGGGLVLTDAVTLNGRAGTFLVDRAGGRLHLTGADQQLTPLESYAVPGRPYRAARAPDDGAFVLTADGIIWRLDAAGKVVLGWDAAGAPNGPRAHLIDIGVDSEWRVYALDQASSSVLVFEPVQSGSVAVPRLPPPCSLVTDKAASADDVGVTNPVSVTLTLEGACGRAFSRNDILLAIDLRRSEWVDRNYVEAGRTLLNAIDWTKDRVAIMPLDSSGRVLMPFTSDPEPVKAALASAPDDPVYELDVHPLGPLREYIETHARPNANRVLIVITEGRPFNIEAAMAGQELRESRIRTIVITDGGMDSFYALVSIAYQLEDYLEAPDAATLRVVYNNLGVEFSARVLARDLTVADTLPANMEYVPGSAVPPARWDAATRRLTWRASDVSFAGWRASYQVIPQQEGYWPTNVWAEADFVDGIGHAGQASFPIPWIRVLPPRPTPTPDPRPERVYLPGVLARYTGIGEE
jgi:hypothetical protein